VLNPGPEDLLAGFERTATRAILGMASLSNASRFPFNSRERVINPVMFVPGRPKLTMNPSSTGLSSAAMTMGMVLVACFAAYVVPVPPVTITSTFSRTSSAANAGRRCTFPSANRSRMAMS